MKVPQHIDSLTLKRGKVKNFLFNQYFRNLSSAQKKYREVT